MTRVPVLRHWAWLPALMLLPLQVAADSLRIAVASNFRPAMQHLESVFEKQSGHDVSVSYGSTGKHYAQIVNGAPFEIFLAADTERPARLEEQNLAVRGSRSTYAAGRLVLWGPDIDVARIGESYLRAARFRFLAIANPDTAPYGRAAEQLLVNLGAWEGSQSRLVRGENIAQAFAYVSSGNADAGLLALSQMSRLRGMEDRRYWLIPQNLYEPIEQQAVLLKDTQAARAFLAFLAGPEAKSVIVDFGYSLP